MLSSREAARTLLVSSIEYQAYYLCRFNLAPALPLLMIQFRLSHSEAGALGSMLFISYALILFPAGVLGDLFGPRLIITLGALLSAAMNAIFGYSTSFPSMLVIQFVNGLGQGMAWGPLTRLMANWYPREKMGFVMSLLSIPPALGPPAAYLLSGYLASTCNWRAAFQVPSLLLAATSLLFLLLTKDSPSGSRSSFTWSRSMIVELLGKREIWLVGFTYLALSSAMRGLLVWLPTFLVEKMGITLVAASSLAGLLSLPGIPSMFVGTWISDVKLQGRKSAVIAASLLGSIPILLLLSLIKEQVQLLWLLALLYALFYSSAGLYFAYPSALLPKEQVGAGSGLIDMLGYIGSFLGTMVTGVAIDTFNSYDSMFLILAGATLIGALAIAKVKP